MENPNRLLTNQPLIVAAILFIATKVDGTPNVLENFCNVSCRLIGLRA